MINFLKALGAVVGLGLAASFMAHGLHASGWISRELELWLAGNLTGMAVMWAWRRWP